jgi:hypothetical protein
MNRFIAALFVLCFVGSNALQASDIEIIEQKVSLPALMFTGLANPFPVLYVFDADKRLIVKAQGPADKSFEASTISSVVNSDTSNELTISKEHSELLWSYLDGVTSKNRVAFFLTLDESMGDSPMMKSRLAAAKEGLYEAKDGTLLVILKGTN